jgi:hypothetical protein
VHTVDIDLLVGGQGIVVTSVGIALLLAGQRIVVHIVDIELLLVGSKVAVQIGGIVHLVGSRVLDWIPGSSVVPIGLLFGVVVAWNFEDLSVVVAAVVV